MDYGRRLDDCLSNAKIVALASSKPQEPGSLAYLLSALYEICSDRLAVSFIVLSQLLT